MGNSHPSPITNKAMLEKDGAFELSLDGTQLKAGLLPLARLPATLTGKDADTLDGIDSIGYVRNLTLDEFQANPATGNATDPEEINDGTPATCTYFDSEGVYCEIDIGVLRLVKQYKFFGQASNQETNLTKIQHWDGESWVDNTTGIAAHLNVWGDWTDLTTPVITSKIRIVCEHLEAPSPHLYWCELYMKGEIA